MSRIDRNKEKAKERKIVFAKIIGVCAIIFVSVTSLSFGYFVNRENNKIRNFITNYDKTKNVYNLQKDFEGGKF